MQKLGAQRTSFETIVAFGANTAFAHHSTSDRRISKNEPILIDLGCVYNGYCSDMTRTCFFGGIDLELKRMYDIVYEAKLIAEGMLKDGAVAGDLDAAAREFIERNGYTLGHSLGHGVGLSVHESPYLRNGNDVILKEGMVITIEPGIYVKDVGGVRLEDLYLVTPDGFVKLSNSKLDKEGLII